MYRQGTEMPPQTTPASERWMAPASVPPAVPLRICQGIPSRMAAPRSVATIFSGTIVRPSIKLMAAPAPTVVTDRCDGVSAMSLAVVPSRMRATSGCTRAAVTVAPRRPSSSCTVNTAHRSHL